MQRHFQELLAESEGLKAADYAVTEHGIDGLNLSPCLSTNIANHANV